MKLKETKKGGVLKNLLCFGLVEETRSPFDVHVFVPHTDEGLYHHSISLTIGHPQSCFDQLKYQEGLTL